MALAPPDGLEIGIEELDAQHRAFYSKINQLHDAMKANDLDQASATVEYLDRYATEHFSTEERLMIDSGYPGFPDHLARHEDFKREFRTWRSRLAADGATAALVVELSSWLTTWLREHIRRVDVEMARFLRSHKPAH